MVVRFEEEYSAVAGLVNASGSWQRCVGAERIAQHANPGLLSSPIRLSAFSQNVIKRNQAANHHTKKRRRDHPPPKLVGWLVGCALSPDFPDGLAGGLVVGLTGRLAVISFN